MGTLLNYITILLEHMPTKQKRININIPPENRLALDQKIFKDLYLLPQFDPAAKG
jgi:hypothetical protein